MTDHNLHALSYIDFQSEDVEMPFDGLEIYIKWIEQTILNEDKKLHRIDFIFCSDEYLLKINQTHLQHDTYTDIITFEYNNNPIESDIFISTERVRENATKFNVSFLEELNRVIIHGVLHLCGYPDKTASQKVVMRSKEEYYMNELCPK